MVPGRAQFPLLCPTNSSPAMSDQHPTHHNQQSTNDLINLKRMTAEQFSLLNDNIPTSPNSFRQSGPAAPMTLKEQEKVNLQQCLDNQ